MGLELKHVNMKLEEYVIEFKAQLKQQIIDEIKEDLAPLTYELRHMSTPETMKLLNVSEGTLLNWRKQDCPHTIVRGKIFYDKVKLDQWMKDWQKNYG